jgi:hypothetical protein
MNQYRIAREIAAAKALRDQIATLVADAAADETWINDTLEGEVDFETIVTRLVDAIEEDKSVLVGIKERSEQLKERKARFDRRIEACRTLLLTALQTSGRDKLRTSSGALVSLKAVGPATVVVDESAIPARFFKQPPPVLDRVALLAALKDGEEVTGAALSNGGQTIAIR